MVNLGTTKKSEVQIVMIALNPEKYVDVAEEIEMLLDEADYAAAASDVRYTHEEVFTRVKDVFNG
jgi:DNA replication initiation complex subunit (GINS family)